MATKTLVTLCLAAMLLFVPVITTGTTPTASPATSRVIPLPSDDAVVAARVSACWKSIQRVESCAGDIIRWLASLDVVVVPVISPVCCDVLETIGDKCFQEVISKLPPVSSLYPPFVKVKHACGIPISSPRRHD